MTQPLSTQHDLFRFDSGIPARGESNHLWDDLDDSELQYDPGIFQPVAIPSKRKLPVLRLTIISILMLAGAGIAGLAFTETHNAMPDMAAATVASPAAVPVAPVAQASAPTSEITADGGIAILPASNPAILKLQKQAAKGDLKAQYKLAGLYSAGKDIGVDLKLSQALLTNAAAAGYQPAMFDLGQAYQEGRFAEPDYRAASRWYEAAAATGHADAAYNLGLMYEKGANGAPDNALALGWYQRAASYGSDKALAGIARLTPKSVPLTDSDIATLQQALNERGYDAGLVNGKMGARTSEAIRQYQAVIGVMQDGRASRFLLDHLLKTADQGDR